MFKEVSSTLLKTITSCYFNNNSVRKPKPSFFFDSAVLNKHYNLFLLLLYNLFQCNDPIIFLKYELKILQT